MRMRATAGPFLLLVLSIAACHRDPLAAVPPPTDTPRLVRDAGGREVLELGAAPIPGLTFAEVRRADLPPMIETTGEVALDDRRTATIISRVAGRVEDTYVSQWDHVARGQVIARLYSPDYMTAAAEYLQAIATSRVSDAAGHGEPSQLAAEIVAAARTKLELLGIEKADIERLDSAKPTFVMRAPIGGAVVQKEVVKGSQVAPGDVLFSLGVADEVWITADVYESDLARVHEGEALEAVPVALPDRRFRGVIARVSPTIDANTHTAQIRCQVSNPSLELKPQMLMRVRIATRSGGALLVPQEALVFETDGYYAFVAIDPQRVTRRKVTIAAWNEAGHARVVDGLAERERVIEGESVQINALWHRAHGESS
jgi:membrane fusion protein, copper/silver efflux system